MPEENNGQLGKAVKQALQEVHVQGLVERITKLLTDVDVMVDYAVESGKTMSPELIRCLAKLDCDREELCQKPQQAVHGEAGPGPVQEGEDGQPPKGESRECDTKYENLVKVHNLLVGMVAPATPTTLRSTEPLWIFFTKSWTMNIILLLTIGSLIAVVVCYVVGPSKAEAANGLGKWSMLFAAMLGAGLFSLVQARNYLLERTYSPQYDMAYYIRYFTGVTAGVILAIFGKDIFFAAGGGSPAATGGETAKTGIESFKELGPTVLALVGGFAADAVLQLLQRVGDTLRTMVRGTDKDVTEKQGKAAKAEAAAAAAKLRSDFITQLNKLSTGEPEGTQKKIKELIKKIAP